MRAVGECRHVPDPCPVLRGRQAEPALAGAEEIAAVDKAQHVRHRGERVPVFRQILPRELAAGAVEQRLERHRLFLQPTLERALRQPEAGGHVLPARFALRQPARDLGAHQAAGRGLAQEAQLVVQQVLLHLAQDGMMGGQWHGQVGTRQQHAVGGGVESHLAAEGLAMQPVAGRRRVDELHGQRLQLAPREPLALHEDGQQGVFDALARNRQAAAGVLHHHPAAARLALQREGGRVGDDRHVAREPRERRAQVGAAGHGVADRAQLAVRGGQVAMQAQRGLAGARHGQLPEHGDFIDRNARILAAQRIGIEAGIAQQRRHVEPFGLEHREHAFEPRGRAGPQLGLLRAARSALGPALGVWHGGS